MVRGFKEDLRKIKRVDSPPAGKATLRMFLTVLVVKSSSCRSIDIKYAFLQGSDFQR